MGNIRWLVSGKFRKGHRLQSKKYWENFEIVTDSDKNILDSPARWMIEKKLSEVLKYYSSGDIEIDLTRKCTSGGICIIDIMGNWCKFCKVPFSNPLA